MSEAKRFAAQLSAGQITPNAVERRIMELETELDDSKFFGKAPEIIANLEGRVQELKKLLAEGFTVVKVQESSFGSGTVTSSSTAEIKPLPRAEKVVKITELFDGTRLTEAESQEVMNLMKMAATGKISKVTLMDSLRGLDPIIEKAKRREDPLLQEHLWKRLMMQHVLERGEFLRIRRKRRNPDDAVRALEEQLALNPDDLETKIALYQQYLRRGTADQILKKYESDIKNSFDMTLSNAASWSPASEPNTLVSIIAHRDYLPPILDEYLNNLGFTLQITNRPEQNGDPHRWLMAEAMTKDWNTKRPVINAYDQTNGIVNALLFCRTSTGYGVRFARWFAHIASSKGFHGQMDANQATSQILSSTSDRYPYQFPAEACMLRASYWTAPFPSAEKLVQIDNRPV